MLLLAVLFASFAAQARLYQWVSPQTGNVHFSGAPPAWYRSGKPGPRVLVYDNGYLIDDTAIALPARRREALREEAFQALAEQQRREQARQAALAGLEQAAAREQARRAKGEAGAKTQPERQAQKSAAAGSSDTQPLDAKTIQRLKSIISEWDERHAELPSNSETATSNSGASRP